MIGQTVGHYRILERLGGGGMGVVYKAEDVTLHREVALKFLPPELTRDDDAKQRFLVEARAAAKLDHPNICNVHEVGESGDGHTFIAMSYYEGESLAKRIERGPIPVDEAAKIAIEVARGLGKAHQSGIIHRDIKPANVMLTSDGGVKIVDFGVAKLAGVTMTHGAGSPGTLAYMAPEQIRGEPVTTATDLWALGAVFYEMLTGSRPFRGDYEQAVAYTILNESPQPLDQTLPTRSPALDDVIAKALTKDAKQRYQTAEELIEGLETVTGARATPSHVPASAHRLNVRQLVLVAALFVVIAAAAASWLWRAERAEVVPDVATAPPSGVASRLDPLQVVIAPFENRTGDATLDPVGRMAVDWITDELTRIDVRVLSRQYLADTVASLRKGGASDADLGIALAETTRSGLLVTGEYYVSGSLLTIRMRVVDVASRKTLHALEMAEGPRADPRAAIVIAGHHVRDALAVRVLGSKSVVASGTATALESSPPRYEAYAEMLLALEAQNVPNYGNAREHIKKAIDLDPDFVAAYLALSNLHYYANEIREAKEALARAEERRASLSPAGRFELDLSRAVLYGKWEDALVTARDVNRLMPGDFRAQYELMNVLLATGRARETVQLISKHDGWKEAVGQIPRYRLHILRTLTQALAVLGDHERELTEARKCRGEFPSDMHCRDMEARALASLGRSEEFAKAVEESLNRPGASLESILWVRRWVGVLRALGRSHEARALAESVIARIRELPSEEQRKARGALSRMLFETGKLDEAEDVIAAIAKDVVGKPVELTVLGELGVVAAARGDRARAVRISGDLMRFRDEDDLGGVNFQRARIAASLGDQPATVDLLKKAFADGWSAWHNFHQLTLAEDPAFDSLRGYPPFEEMLKSRD